MKLQVQSTLTWVNENSEGQKLGNFSGILLEFKSKIKVGCEQIASMTHLKPS